MLTRTKRLERTFTAATRVRLPYGTFLPLNYYSGSARRAFRAGDAVVTRIAKSLMPGITRRAHNPTSIQVSRMTNALIRGWGHAVVRRNSSSERAYAYLRPAFTDRAKALACQATGIGKEAAIHRSSHSPLYRKNKCLMPSSLTPKTSISLK